MTVEECLAEMLVENTGRHMLDSGGAYGRDWERNQKRAAEFPSALDCFLAQPPVTLEFSLIAAEREQECRPEISLNVFHWLKAHFVEYMEDDTQAFHEWADEDAQDGMYWPELMKTWAKQHYDDGEPCIVNTYNGECLLSQTLQFCQAGVYVLLQIHGGCDVRGGYTAPRIFTSTDAYGLCDGARATIHPESAPSVVDTPRIIVPPTVWPPSWYTDDGWNWYPDGGECSSLHHYLLTDDPDLRGEQRVYVDDDRNGYCPITGRKLVAGYY